MFLPSALAAASIAACGSLDGSATRLDLLGSAAPATASQRAIAIASDTKWVNVTGGEIVTFNAGDKSFTWNFDTALSISQFDLGRIAPPGILNHTVIVYVAPNPLYRGGSERDAESGH